jgi:membrane protein YqaA with SNARE-associated domain
MRFGLWRRSLSSKSSVFPIPPDILIIPMVLAAPTRAWRVALVATVASVIGGLFGYVIGAFLFEALAQPILAFYGYEARFADFQERYNEWGAWIVAGAGFTPFPYKVITIASGATGLDPTVFIIASVLSRGGRFFLIAALLWRFGVPIRGFL